MIILTSSDTLPLEKIFFPEFLYVSRREALWENQLTFVQDFSNDLLHRGIGKMISNKFLSLPRQFHPKEIIPAQADNPRCKFLWRIRNNCIFP